MTEQYVGFGYQATELELALPNRQPERAAYGSAVLFFTPSAEAAAYVFSPVREKYLSSYIVQPGR